MTYAALATLTAVTVRPFRPADESANVGYVMELVTESRIPHAREVVDQDLPGQVRVTQHTAKHPPLYYAAQVPVMWLGLELGRPMLAFFAARLLSVVFGGITILLLGLLLVDLADRGYPGLPVAAVMYAATLTPFVVVGGLIHNDAMSAMWAMLALVGLVRIFRHGFTRWALAAMFAGCIGGLLTRVQAIGVVGVCGLGLVLAAALADGQWSWHGTARGIRWAAFLGMACLVTSGWFYWHNFQTYGDPTGGIAAAARSDRAERGMPFLSLFADARIWLSLLLNVRARLGYAWAATNVSASVAVLSLIGLGLLSAVVRAAMGWLRGTRPRLRAFLLASLLGLLVVEMVVMAIRHLISGGNLHNRYMFPALGAVAAGAGLGLLALPLGRRGVFAVLVSGIQVCISLVYIAWVAATSLPDALVPPHGVPESWLARLRFGLHLNEIPAADVVLTFLLVAAVLGLVVSSRGLWLLSTPLGGGVGPVSSTDLLRAPGETEPPLD